MIPNSDESPREVPGPHGRGPRGRLICFEGLDGAGKTTTAALLAEALAGRGERAAFFSKKSTAVADPRLAARMANLKTLIWDYGDAPIMQLGDEHSLYLMASWFAAFDRGIVRPALEAGTTVVVDNWYHKFLARFKLKPRFDFARAAQVFDGVTAVDAVIYLDIPAANAGARKGTFTQAEAGNLDGLDGATVENFVRYQENVRGVLLGWAQAEEWLIVPVRQQTPPELAGEILRALPGRDDPARG
jgi:thymidylate kinase